MAPAFDAYVPAVHVVQTEDVVVEKVPLEQVWQVVDPAAPEYLPAVQSGHEFPLTALHVPI